MKKLTDLMEECPVIASVKNEEAFRVALESPCAVMFILFGNICNIASLVKRAHNKGKVAMVHFDLVEGAASKEIVVDYLKNYARADGIISSRANILKAAKNRNFFFIRAHLVNSG